MIKVENKTASEIAELGRKIGEAFAAENGGIASSLTKEHIVKFFEIMTECYYRAGVLYSTENGEGYLAFWEKNSKPAFRHTLHMIKRLLSEMPLKAVLAVSQSGSAHFEKLFKKEKNYIAVSMVVVLREFQGRGFMHKVLELPFSEADKKNIYCVLDTDTELKAKKYTRCGMKIAGRKKLKNNVTLYALAYRNSQL
ncbi:MAG: N-acetyltransferase [Lachnospiraceae bacterium]|nr:N-acetyltransferase [Ruminococcus sp.]MCM1273739.1 N-acetyltransferase [Lachnospiraceae bacterium]